MAIRAPDGANNEKDIFNFQELLQMIRHLSPFERLHLKVRCVSINAKSVGVLKLFVINQSLTIFPA